jgi:hypothetical protein
MLDHESVRRLRAHAQALAGGAREASAEAVIRRVFAIQAQDATAADLGIRVRGRDITARAIRTAYGRVHFPGGCARPRRADHRADPPPASAGRAGRSR